MTNYTTANLLAVSPSTVAEGTLAAKIGGIHFVAATAMDNALIATTNIAKITEFTPARDAFSGVTEITIADLTTIGEVEWDWYMDVSQYNGTYRITPETEFLSGFARVFQHTTNPNLYIVGYDSTSYEWSELPSGWSVQQGTGTPSYYGSGLFCAGSTIPTGTSTWTNSEYGSTTATTSATTTTYAAQLLVLKGQKLTGLNRPYRTYTYDDSIILFTDYEQVPELGQLYTFDEEIDPVTGESRYYLIGNAIDTDYSLSPVQIIDRHTLLNAPLYTPEAVSKITLSYIEILVDDDNDATTDPVARRYLRSAANDYINGSTTAYAWADEDTTLYTATEEPEVGSNCYIDTAMSQGETAITAVTNTVYFRYFSFDTQATINDVSTQVYGWRDTVYNVIYTQTEEPLAGSSCFSDTLLSENEQAITKVFIGDATKCLRDRSYYNRTLTTTKPANVASLKIKPYGYLANGVTTAIQGGMDMSSVTLSVVPTATEFNVGTNDFCIEFYLYPKGIDHTNTHILTFSNLTIQLGQGSMGGANCLNLYLNGTVYEGLNVKTLTQGMYHQIALFRVSGNMTCYIDGVAYAISTDTSALSLSLSSSYDNTITIGNNEYGSSVLISNLRISNIGRYSQSVMPVNNDNLPAIPPNALFYDALTTYENWIGYSNANLTLRTTNSGRTFIVCNDKIYLNQTMTNVFNYTGTQAFYFRQDLSGVRANLAHQLYLVPYTGSFSFWTAYGVNSPVTDQFYYGPGFGTALTSTVTDLDASGNVIQSNSYTSMLNEFCIGLVNNKPAVLINGIGYEILTTPVDIDVPYIGNPYYQIWQHHVVVIEPEVSSEVSTGLSPTPWDTYRQIDTVRISYYLNGTMLWSQVTNAIPGTLHGDWIRSYNYPENEAHSEYSEQELMRNGLYLHHPWHSYTNGDSTFYSYADLRVYERRLTDEEINALYQNRTV